jgi:aldose 1-epimerase
MPLIENLYGKTPDGTSVYQYTMNSPTGVTATAMSYGAILLSVQAPDRNGRAEEITLGFDSLGGYLGEHPYFGATIGRFANRIDSGKFILGGAEYILACNENGQHHLHGGNKGFDKVMWKSRASEDSVSVAYQSSDGEEGYPGNLNVTVTYSLNSENELRVAYEAESDKPTPVNLTNHTYWNLAGAGAGSILGHELLMHCSKYLPVDEKLIPTGELKDVQGTPMDFMQKHKLGERIDAVAGGYDHCYVIDSTDSMEELKDVCTICDPESGRSMEIQTTQPGVQLYTGNFLDGIEGRGGVSYAKHSGFCLETQNFPNAVNSPGFPSAILEPGSMYRHTTLYRFSAK